MTYARKLTESLSYSKPYDFDSEPDVDDVEALINRAMEHERERCAKLCRERVIELTHTPNPPQGDVYKARANALNCAADLIAALPPEEVT